MVGQLFVKSCRVGYVNIYLIFIDHEWLDKEVVQYG